MNQIFTNAQQTFGVYKYYINLDTKGAAVHSTFNNASVIFSPNRIEMLRLEDKNGPQGVSRALATFRKDVLIEQSLQT